MAVRAGSKNDPAAATGLAHYLEHMVFKGTSRARHARTGAKEKPELDKIEALYEVYRGAAQRPGSPQAHLPPD
ncbi:MAG: insulinase family protein [Hymenobacter sp.]